MAVQLIGIRASLSQTGVSLTPATPQMPWGGESLLGVGVSLIPQLDGDNYAVEDLSALYVAENGATFYVQEI